MAALGIIGFLGSLVCLVLVIISVIRKNGKAKTWAIGLGVFFVLFIVGAVNSGSTDNNPNDAISSGKSTVSTTTQTTSDQAETRSAEETTTAKAEAAAPESNKTTYSDGTYLVGKDIQSGLYKVTLKDNIMKMGYVERSKDLNMELDSIIANILLTGNGYVEIKSTDVAVKLTGVEIEPINLDDIKPDIKNEVSDGIYLVGYDIAPGTYKVEVTDTTTNMGYIERSKSVAMDTDDIIANEIQQGPGYVKIEQGDFAVRLQGVKITFQQ